MTIHLIYPLGDGSPWHDHEIRFSVASVRKHCTDPDIAIHICGMEPRQHIRDVEFISVPKISSSRYQIVAYNILMAITHIHPEMCVIMNDDFFAIRPFSFRDMPLYYDMSIEQRSVKPGISPAYRTNLLNSMRSIDDLNFAVHFPLPVRYVDIMKNVLHECRHKEAVSFRNLYGNRVIGKDTIVQKQDIKLHNPMRIEEIITTLSGETWFSIGDKFLNNSGRTFLTRMLS